jgi:hypothetical protein
MSGIILGQTLAQASAGNHVIIGQTLHGLELQDNVSFSEVISLDSNIPTRVRRSLEENRFWLRIMMEHAFFLRLGFPSDATNLIKQAKQFQEIFERQLERALKTPPEPKLVKLLNRDSILLTRRIANFKQKVLTDIITCRLRGFNFPLLVDHIRREALYFLKTLQDLTQGVVKPIRDDIIDENVFFLQIMAEHSKFISHLLDPTERKLILAADRFGQRFDTLLAQAKNIDFSSREKAINSLNVVKGSTTELRNFKRQATKLIEDCQIRSIIHPRLAAHVTREANKFLSIIERLEERVS